MKHLRKIAKMCFLLFFSFFFFKPYLPQLFFVSPHSLTHLVNEKECPSAMRKVVNLWLNCSIEYSENRQFKVFLASVFWSMFVSPFLSFTIQRQ